MAFVYRVFLKGLLTLLPITLTVYLLFWVFTRAELAFGTPIRASLPGILDFPGIGVVLALLFIFIVGLLVNNYLTQSIFDWVERRLEKMPVIRAIYGPLRDVTNLFASQAKGGINQKVVMVAMGSNGLEMMGLVTRDTFGDLPKGTIPEGSIAVFIPLSYGMGGYTYIVPKTRIRETAIPADKAMQLAITGWIKSK